MEERRKAGGREGGKVPGVIGVRRDTPAARCNPVSRVRHHHQNAVCKRGGSGAWACDHDRAPPRLISWETVVTNLR